MPRRHRSGRKLTDQRTHITHPIQQVTVPARVGAISENDGASLVVSNGARSGRGDLHRRRAPRSCPRPPQHGTVHGGLDAIGATRTRSRFARPPASSPATCSPYAQAAREPVTVTRSFIGRAKNDDAPRTNRTYEARSPRSSSARGQCASPGISMAIPLSSTMRSRWSRPSSLPGEVRRSRHTWASTRPNPGTPVSASSSPSVATAPQPSCDGIIGFSQQRQHHPRTTFINTKTSNSKHHAVPPRTDFPRKGAPTQPAVLARWSGRGGWRT